MNEKLKHRRNEERICRPPLLLRILCGLMGLFPIVLLYVIFVGVLPSQLNHPSLGELYIPVLWSLVLLNVIGYGWHYLVTSFHISLRCGEFRGSGYRITFRWDQVQGIEWVKWSNRRVLCLLLRETETVSKNIWVRDSRVSEHQLPLQYFTPIGNSQFFEKAFIDTPLGQEFLTYVPRIYEPYLEEEKAKPKR
jgi:hypothetical protein